MTTTNPLLSVDEALSRLLSMVEPQLRTETIPTIEAGGRVLAEDQYSQIAVPAFDNSAMDGYALHIGDFESLPKQFPVVQRIAAGDTGVALQVGEAARIFTGAPVPEGCNAVVMQEDCVIEEGILQVSGQIRAGQHIRCAGEDIQIGQCILQAGTLLKPQHVAQAASVGLAVLPVFKTLKVGVFFTGNELVMPGNPLPPGGIYNSNRFSVVSLLRNLGCEVTDYGTVPDNLEATVSTLAMAAISNHVVLTSGGVSVGEEDHVKRAVQKLGEIDVWRIAMKPGKPLAVGRLDRTLFIGLPGNPVSTFVTFCMMARPIILRAMGVKDVSTRQYQLPAAFNWPKADKRREFLRARINEQGQVELYPHQGSGVLSSVVWGHGLVDLPAGQTVNTGDRVCFISYDSLVSA